MSTLHQLPDMDRIEHEASVWIARLHSDDITPEELAQLQAWRSAHARHREVLDAMLSTVDEVKRAAGIVRAVSFGHAMNAATVAPKRRGVFRAALAAAVVVLAVALGFWMMREKPKTLFQTAIGEHASVELPDGSRLELNSNSMAQVQYSAEARTIHLMHGEAFFKVAHEPQRPFWVVAGNSWIRAVGTAFNVDLRPEGVRVIVSEGTVKVASARAAADVPSDTSLARAPVSVLSAGQEADVRMDTTEIRAVAPVELSRVSAWRRGNVYFENQPLGTVIEELSRYTSAHIVIEDEALRSLPIGGTFQASPQGVESLLGMLEEGFGLRVRRESGNRIYIENASGA
jgi:transmembrane sensor